MAKRRIKFKLGEIKISGVEFEIEDDRESATAAFASLQDQLAGVVQPVVGRALLGAGQVVDAPSVDSERPATTVAPRKRRKLSSSAPGKAGEEGAAQPISFVHNPDKFGNPQQGWTTPNKAIWLLWVVEQATGVKELTVTSIANVFNQHYRDFGIIRKGNVQRDLGIHVRRTRRQLAQTPIDRHKCGSCTIRAKTMLNA